jgi:hypothetical protein
VSPFTRDQIAAGAAFAHDRYAHYFGMMQVGYGLAVVRRGEPVAAAPPKPRTSKCTGCGSREFRYIDTRQICSYCRSEQ